MNKINTHATVRTDAKNVAKDQLTDCNDAASEESIVSMSWDLMSQIYETWLKEYLAKSVEYAAYGDVKPYASEETNKWNYLEG